MAAVVVIALVVLIVPKPDAIEPLAKAPTVVREEDTTALPSVVALSVVAPFILKCFPFAKSKSSLTVQPLLESY
jgi:hypothetical protein